MVAVKVVVVVIAVVVVVVVERRQMEGHGKTSVRSGDANLLSYFGRLNQRSEQLMPFLSVLRLLDLIPSNTTTATRICRPGPYHRARRSHRSAEKKCLIMGDSISIGCGAMFVVY